MKKIMLTFCKFLHFRVQNGQEQNMSSAVPFKISSDYFFFSVFENCFATKLRNGCTIFTKTGPNPCDTSCLTTFSLFSNEPNCLLNTCSSLKSR